MRNGRGRKTPNAQREGQETSVLPKMRSHRGPNPNAAREWSPGPQRKGSAVRTHRARWCECVREGWGGWQPLHCGKQREMPVWDLKSGSTSPW